MSRFQMELAKEESPLFWTRAFSWGTGRAESWGHFSLGLGMMCGWTLKERSAES